MEKTEIQRLFKQHYAKMYRVARTILYDELECEDVISDIFESLLRGQIVLLSETEERYLLTSVCNRCLKRIRHKEVQKQMEDYCLAALSDDDESEDERMTDITEFAVTHLSTQEQRIFQLRFIEGYSYEEIAASEGISKVAVWKHLSHVLNVVKNHFNK
ncbi:MAG: sigma-70 family RNA polymerase sigma factor [Bacteroidaceae bacterium]|nr:sigma-70 family RNA polymerase sigma factor [Bacteroidaceae bacterium]